MTKIYVDEGAEGGEGGEGEEKLKSSTVENLVPIPPRSILLQDGGCYNGLFQNVFFEFFWSKICSFEHQS